MEESMTKIETILQRKFVKRLPRVTTPIKLQTRPNYKDLTLDLQSQQSQSAMSQTGFAAKQLDECSAELPIPASDKKSQ